tara:strand:- start:11488 stop:11817 length:330 start_codon:yes stop_codon:yes gene_type:complete
MTYMIDRWNEGEVRFVDGAVGWIMKDGEFRPLMSDAVAELHDAGYISSITVEATAIARDRYTQRTLAEYAEAQRSRTAEEIAEQRAEARAAMGAGVEMVNIFTGETYTT